MIGIVYKIKCNITNEVYYGSTKQRLKDRIWTHKSPSACRSYLIVKRGDWEIEILETFDNELEMKQREKYYINNFTCINKNNVLRTHEDLIEYHRRYREHNKDKVKEYQKRYMENNKEKKKLYYETNKERILSRGSEPVECECGGRYVLKHKQKHLRTKKHTAFSLKP